MLSVLEVMVSNRREGGENSMVERGHTTVFKNGNEWEVRSLALMPLYTYIGKGYLQVSPWWGWILHDITLATSWASSRYVPHTSCPPKKSRPSAIRLYMAGTK